MFLTLDNTSKCNSLFLIENPILKLFEYIFKKKKKNYTWHCMQFQTTIPKIIQIFRKSIHI